MFKLPFLLLALMIALSSQKSRFKTLDGKPPIIIAHRGASGYRPDHTINGYELAITLGSDYIEPDLVMTKDGHLICRHEPMLSYSTNIASLPEFADRKTTKVVDGVTYTDWFAGDFTLAEIKKLKAIQILPTRPQYYNDLYSVATLEEAIDLVKRRSQNRKTPIGIYMETKRPTFHESYGLHITSKLLEVLKKAGWDHYSSPVFIESFEVSNLQWISKRSTVKNIQLMQPQNITKDGVLTYDGLIGKPYDWIAAGDSRTYEDLITDKGLDFVKSYAFGVGVAKSFVIPYTFQDEDCDGSPDDLNGDGLIDMRDRMRLHTTDFVKRAHKKGLVVHSWTHINEASSLLEDYDGNPLEEYYDFYEAGIDGVFTDYPDTALIALNTV